MPVSHGGGHMATTSPIKIGSAIISGGPFAKSLEKSVIGYEGDHLTLDQFAKLNSTLEPTNSINLSVPIMQQRMQKSPAEITLIREAARIADIGGYAVKATIRA